MDPGFFVTSNVLLHFEFLCASWRSLRPFGGRKNANPDVSGRRGRKEERCVAGTFLKCEPFTTL